MTQDSLSSPRRLIDLLPLSQDDDALLGVGGVCLSYAELRRQVDHLAGQLATAGIHRGDRVAIVLDNGPAAAIAFLAVAVCATAAPLNPAFRDEEFARYLPDLGVKAIITQPSDAAKPLVSTPNVLRLLLTGEPGAFSLHLEGLSLSPVEPVYAGRDDVALVLHTSGTTSKPKIVPLSQANILTSVVNFSRSLALTRQDRYLNVMPLYHIHGLIALLATLGSGGSVACSPGFHAFRFFAWLAEFDPTWFSAVPTMHQVIIERAARQAEPAAALAPRLRLVRSSSAALPPSVMEQLEAIFAVPVIEAYGMTEASHLIASNPLPPGVRKPGSVGLGASVKVAIMDEAGKLLPTNTRGEVVIAGANVTLGYESNPAANDASFESGWFRTGDQGYQDTDGYIFLTGRLKEIINRGGEKISPIEIDDVLLRHPDVSRAVAFAMADPRLGEEVAAAVVLQPGATADERALREHAARYLADFKVPRRIVLLDELPLGPTGKVQRIGLAERLGLSAGG